MIKLNTLDNWRFKYSSVYYHGWDLNGIYQCGEVCRSAPTPLAVSIYDEIQSSCMFLWSRVVDIN